MAEKEKKIAVIEPETKEQAGKGCVGYWHMDRA